jgi:hypothetical protein
LDPFGSGLRRIRGDRRSGFLARMVDLIRAVGLKLVIVVCGGARNRIWEGLLLWGVVGCLARMVRVRSVIPVSSICSMKLLMHVIRGTMNMFDEITHPCYPRNYYGQHLGLKFAE